MLKLLIVCSMAGGVVFLPPGARAQRAARPAITQLLAGDLVTVDWIAVSAEGQVAVWQAGDNLIRRFDAAGTELSSIGAKGEGPGEFRMMSIGGFAGESLWVSDPMLRRTTFFDADGQLLRTEPWARTLSFEGEGMIAGLGVQPMAILPDGDYVVLARPPTSLPPPRWWPDTSGGEAALASSPSGEVRLVLAAIPTDLETCRTRFKAGSGSGSVTTPFCPTSTYREIDAVFGGLSMVEQPSDDEPQARVTISVIDFLGQTRFRRQLTIPRVRLADRAWRSALEARRVPSFAPAFQREPTNAALSRLRKPDYHPAIDDAILGTDGTMLLRLGGPVIDGGRRWLMVRHQDPVRELVLPAELDVYELTRNTGWGVLLDRDDVPTGVMIEFP